MQTFGYLQSTTNGSDSEALYGEEAIRKAISQVQKFGGLQETGRLNTETVKVEL